jgi:hypothetical protein
MEDSAPGMNYFGQRRRVDGPLMASPEEMVQARERTRQALEARLATAATINATRRRVKKMASSQGKKPKPAPAEEDLGRFSAFYRQEKDAA